MEQKDLKGKVQTVLGLIEPEEMGCTLVHQHVGWGGTTAYNIEPDDEFQKRMQQAKVVPGNDDYRWLNFDPTLSLDNSDLSDEAVVIKEIMNFKHAGGGTICEATPIGDAGRKAPLLAKASKATGIHIICGTGYYMCPGYVAPKSKEALEEEVAREVLEGIGDTGIRAGAINEIAVFYPMTEIDKKVLQACVAAQKRTGVMMSVLSGPNFCIEGAMETLKYIDSLGADLSRLVIGHIDLRDSSIEDRLELLKTGCTVSYDNFGKNAFLPAHMVGDLDIPSDARRIRGMAEIIDKGYINQLVISNDLCLKTHLATYGGWGYGYILEMMLPQMAVRGINAEAIKTIMVDNPRRLLTIV